MKLKQLYELSLYYLVISLAYYFSIPLATYQNYTNNYSLTYQDTPLHAVHVSRIVQGQVIWGLASWAYYAQLLPFP